MVIAYRLLFGIYSGIVPDGIDGPGIGDIDWAGDASVLLSYVKGRTAAESLNLPRRAVRLLEQWLAHSALLRSLAGPGTASGLAGHLPARRQLADHADRPQRDPALGAAPRRDQRRRRPAEDPPGPDPDHPPVPARQERLGRAGAGDDRPQPQPRRSRATTT